MRRRFAHRSRFWRERERDLSKRGVRSAQASVAPVLTSFYSFFQLWNLLLGVAWYGVLLKLYLMLQLAMLF